ncbi:hypothetical protein ACJU26_11040 [Acidithiobacillus sp. M4-SHS-6]|uniref:hypothetical protein n=1 Tax=Acidithiobacillus sp. M4-SHS-6 TaxID=3383024 RepID=UPI0039BE8832
MLWLMPVALWLHITSRSGRYSSLYQGQNRLILMAGTNQHFPPLGKRVSGSIGYAYWGNNINTFAALAHARPDNWILSLGTRSPEGQRRHPVVMAQLFGGLAFAHAKHAILAPSLHCLGLKSGPLSRKWKVLQGQQALSRLLKISAQGNGLVLRVAAYGDKPAEYAQIIRFFSPPIHKEYPNVAIIAALPIPDAKHGNISRRAWLKDIQNTRQLVNGYALLQGKNTTSRHLAWVPSSWIASGVRLAEETQQIS